MDDNSNDGVVDDEEMDYQNGDAGQNGSGQNGNAAQHGLDTAINNINSFEQL
jgi:hypothetical protein